MNPQQKTNVAKYFYDLSKGASLTGVLLGVAELFDYETGDTQTILGFEVNLALLVILFIIICLFVAVVFFILAYRLDGGTESSEEES